MKKLLDAAGRHQSSLAPRTIAAPFTTKFARPQTTRVCNASSKVKLTGMVMVNYRTSQADGIKSRG